MITINRKKKNILEKKYLILAFLLPILLLFSNYKIIGNNYIINSMDVDSQYISILKWIKGVYCFDNSILYSFSKGLGGNMFSTFFYYASSPLNIFILLFKKVENFILFLSTLKIGLSGLTMFLFLSKKGNNKFNLVLSLCYALMGYNVIHIGNFFWLDVVYIAPIVLLGIDNIINNQKSTLFIISLFYAILCNFYIAFGLCIFSVAYLFFEIYYNSIKNKKKIIIQFFSSSFFVGLICSFFLIPIIFELLSNTSRLNFTNIINEDFFRIPNIIYKFLIGSSSFKSYKYMEFYHMPNLYVSLFVFVINLFFLFNKKILKKKKQLVISMSVFFLLSMIFDPLYSLWHGFSKPIGFEYRFSYLWSFFYIYVANIYLSNYNNNLDKKKIIYITIAISIFLIILFLFSHFLFYEKGIELISILFIIIYVILVYKAKFNLAYIIIFIELFLNLFLCTCSQKTMLDDIKDYCLINDKKFFRTNLPKENSSLECGYGSISTYLSTSNFLVNNFFERNGLEVRTNYINYSKTSTPIIDYLFSVKYYIDEDFNIYENNDVLSIGYMIYSDKYLKGDTSLEVQTNLLNIMIGKEMEYFNEYEFELKGSIISYKNNGSNKYLYIENDGFTNVSLKNIEIYEPQENILLNQFLYNNILLNIYDKTYNQGYIKFECLSNANKCRNIKFSLYDLDYQNFKEAVSILKQQQLEVVEFKKNYLMGKIKVLEEDKYLFLSIPYDDGWNVYVDGNKVKYDKLFECFIGVKLSKGVHDIKLIYVPKGFDVGIIVSSVTLVLSFIYVVLEFSIRKK